MYGSREEAWEVVRKHKLIGAYVREYQDVKCDETDNWEQALETVYYISSHPNDCKCKNCPEWTEKEGTDDADLF